jgi:3-oxoacyl-[acyl-carrier-protein] synthase II
MKIAITGMGTIGCCGNTVQDLWAAVVNGKSGIGPLTRFKHKSIRTTNVGEVRDFVLGEQFNPRVRTRTDRHIQYALAATEQAITQSGLNFSQIDPYRISTVVGTCSGSYDYVADSLVHLHQNQSVVPSFLTGSLNNMISAYINMHWNILGSGLAVNGACASGAQAIIVGAMMIETGQADVVIVGGSENWIHPLPIGGLESLKALTYDTQGCRPFDQDRSGFSLSEGAAILVLESAEHAYRRNADILAWLSGYGISSDADHPTAPRADGAVTSHMIKQAAYRAGVGLDQIDYVNAHATGTAIGDKVESEVLYSLFDDKPYVSSTKAVTGHAIGAVGAMEAIISVKTIIEQTIPMTTNLDNPNCPGKHVIGQSIKTKINNVLSNNFGFGGTNSALIFNRV